MALAAGELEKAAIRYASEAVTADKQGARGKAIAGYQQAIETLANLISLYPQYDLNKIYVQRIKSYQQRIKVLKGEVPEEPDIPFTPSSSDQISAQLESVNRTVADQLVLQEKPNVRWADVIGLDDAKRAIRESIVYPTRRPDLFPLGWPRGILLYGPPGCGKTLLAAATAAEIEATFITVDAAAIMSRWLGEAEKNVARVFSLARASKPSALIFIDEVDALFGQHRNDVGGEVRVRNQFLKEMDGLVDKGRNPMVYVIAATNKPWDLDLPFIRRFQKRILVTLPDRAARLNSFQQYTRHLNLAKDVELERLAELTERYSPSDIRDVCQGAHMEVVRELFESGTAESPGSSPRPVNMADFESVLKVRKPTVAQEYLRSYDLFQESFKAL